MVDAEPAIREVLEHTIRLMDEYPQVEPRLSKWEWLFRAQLWLIGSFRFKQMAMQNYLGCRTMMYVTLPGLLDSEECKEWRTAERRRQMYEQIDHEVGLYMSQRPMSVVRKLEIVEAQCFEQGVVYQQLYGYRVETQ